MSVEKAEEQKQEQVARHYYMAAVDVIHDVGGKTETIKQNVLVTHSEPLVVKKMLDNIQINAQIQIANQLGAPVKTTGVVITNISYLGYMTRDEFFVGSDDEATTDDK